MHFVFLRFDHLSKSCHFIGLNETVLILINSLKNDAQEGEPQRLFVLRGLLPQDTRKLQQITLQERRRFLTKSRSHTSL